MTPGRSTPRWLTQTEFAHRGLHTQHIPENSLAAAENALSAGLGIECDIQLSGDKTPFVFHDWELQRLTGQQGRFEDFSDEDVKTLRLLNTASAPPTLTQLLKLVCQRAPILVEIKSRPGIDIELVGAQVLKDVADYPGSFGVMSFDPKVVAWFAANAPLVCRGLVGTDSLPNGFEHVWRDRKIIKQSQPDFLAIDHRDLQNDKAQLWRAAGRPLLSWTIKTPEERQVAQSLADRLIMEGAALL